MARTRKEIMKEVDKLKKFTIENNGEYFLDDFILEVLLDIREKLK